MRIENLKTVFLVLCSAALALAILAYFVVFYPNGSYQPVVIKGNPTTIGNFPTSTAPTSTIGVSTTSTSTAISGNPGAGQFESEYTYPYPVSWNEGHEAFAVTAASAQGNQLTLTLAVQIGNISECVPVNLRLVVDEHGTLQAPDSPAGGSFTFPDTQTCNGTPGATYSQSVVFTVPSSVTPPYLFTTGGASNAFFSAATSTTGGVDVALPSSSG